MSPFGDDWNSIRKMVQEHQRVFEHFRQLQADIGPTLRAQERMFADLRALSTQHEDTMAAL
jgi:hypothetical protein